MIKGKHNKKSRDIDSDQPYLPQVRYSFPNIIQDKPSLSFIERQKISERKNNHISPLKPRFGTPQLDLTLRKQKDYSIDKSNLNQPNKVQHENTQNSSKVYSLNGNQRTHSQSLKYLKKVFLTNSNPISSGSKEAYNNLSNNYTKDRRDSIEVHQKKVKDKFKKVMSLDIKSNFSGFQELILNYKVNIQIMIFIF